MKFLDFNEDEILDIFKIVAAILHLGNISFKSNDNGNAVVIEDEHLSFCAEVGLFWYKLSSSFFCFKNLFINYFFIIFNAYKCKI